MIFFGSSNPKQLSRRKLYGHKCPHCQSVNSLEITVHTGYHHVYGIPMLPSGKKGMVSCDSCEKDLPVYYKNSTLNREVEIDKKNLRNPFWYYSAFFVGGLFFCLITFSIYLDHLNTKEYIQSPMTNDVYEFKTEVGHYSLFKLSDVTKDSVVVFYNMYESTSQSGLNDLDVSRKYDKENLYKLSKADLTEMYKEKRILDINRDSKLVSKIRSIIKKPKK